MFLLKKVLIKMLICAFAFITEIASENGSEVNEFISEVDSYHVSDELEENSQRHFTDTIPGDPNTDYPTYKSIPKTTFSCKGKPNWGYYADVETGCQIFHVCESDYSKISFLCPIGSIFNQRHLVCDWWYNYECNDIIDLFTFDRVFNEELLNVPDLLEDPIEMDLKLASTGGNSPQSNSNLKSMDRSIKRKQIKDKQ